MNCPECGSNRVDEFCLAWEKQTRLTVVGLLVANVGAKEHARPRFTETVNRCVRVAIGCRKCDQVYEEDGTIIGHRRSRNGWFLKPRVES